MQNDYPRSPRPSTSFQQELVDAIYPVPQPLRSEEEWHTYEHRDLTGLPAAELQLQLARLRTRLILDTNPDTWLLERVDRLEEVLGHAA